MRLGLALILLLFFLVSVSTRAQTTSTKPTTKFEVRVSGTDIGFREGDQFYPLGLPLTEFKKRFGPPERESATALSYNRDGLRVIGSNGKVKRYVFFVRRDDMTEHEAGVFEAADVRTEEGISATSTVRQIAKVYGDPVEKSESPTKIWLTYEFGGFTFEGSFLDKISVGPNDRL